MKPTISYSKLEDKIIKLYHSLSSNKLTLAEIKDLWVTDIQAFSNAIYEGEYTPSKEGLKAILMINLDQYTYSDTGDVFISDHEYDVLHQLWKRMGEAPLVYADIFGSEWPMVEHDAPWMVGNVSKVYSLEELRDFINDINEEFGDGGSHPVEWVVAPKFDGVSANLKIKDGKLIQAITRGDRHLGQDITDLVIRSKNLFKVTHWRQHSDGYLKVELCVSSEEFPYLKEAKGYANRRSATTALVNSPKNVIYGNRLEAVPLLWYDENGVDYNPPDSVRLKTVSASELINRALEVLKKVKDPSYPYRADGVVLYPMVIDLNTDDVMKYSMAFKINTAVAHTRIIRGYVSMGRTGYAVPMIQVEPCDVNETVVTDVSLGSFGKYYQLGLHENEEVIIYSAGDVIPQMKRCDPPIYPKHSDYLRIPEVCPYCGSELINAHCLNQNCVRIKTGRITNFLQKLGAENISDATIELLYDNKVIRDIADVLNLKESDLVKLDSFGDLKASNVVGEITKLRQRPITYSEFFGALGCPGVSEKISQAIFQVVPFDSLLHYAKPLNSSDIYLEDNELRDALYQISGIGANRAAVIINFVADHKAEIRDIASMLNLKEDIRFIGSVVFSGFRDKNWVEKFKDIRVRVSESLTKNTIAVVAANLNTGKAKKAIQMGIPIYLYTDIDECYRYCKSIGQ